MPALACGSKSSSTIEQSPGTTTYYWQNYTTHTATSATEPTQYESSQSADFILEEYNPDFVKFGTVNFPHVVAAGSAPGINAEGGQLNALNYREWTLVDSNGTVRAQPSYPPTSAGGFTITAQNTS